MEGRASTFKEVLADFESRLHDAEFVAIDTELTGVDLAGEPDTFEESAQMRLEKNCRIAERYTLIQLGLTVVGRTGEGNENRLSCASYNLFAFPYMGPEVQGNEPGFFCQASAMQFNVQHRVDFNKWIGEGIPYMTREDERRLFKTSQDGANHSDRRSGLLQLWKSLCAARLPFVVHCPLDLFFLLAAFERRQLPRDDPRVLAMMIRQCTPKVYDTAHLHSILGNFKRLGLLKFFEDAKARYDEVRESGPAMERQSPIEFRLEGETAARYSKQYDELAHEAGFDSLITAQLFAYLRVIAPAKVREAANRLFLYRSVEYLDLESAIKSGEVGASTFDLSRVTLLVAALDPSEGGEAPRHIAAAGSESRWIDANHLLVVLRASGGAAVRKAGELASKVHGVVAWMGFDDWRAAQTQAAAQAAAQTTRVSRENGHAAGSQDGSGDAAATLGRSPSASSSASTAEASAPAAASAGAASSCSAGAKLCHGAAGGGGECDFAAASEERGGGVSRSSGGSGCGRGGGGAGAVALARAKDDGDWSLGTFVALGASAGATCGAALALLMLQGGAPIVEEVGGRLLRRWRRR